MLIIKEPIKLKSLSPIIRRSDGFCERMSANYQVLQAKYGPEDLFHLLEQPPQVYVNEGGMTTFVTQNQNQMNQEVRLEMVHNLINRLMTAKSYRLTYQDMVYVQSMLQKLGVKHVSEFMEQLYETREDTQNIQKLTKLYEKNMTVLKKAVQSVGKDWNLGERQKADAMSGEQEEQAKENGRSSVWWLHQEIFRHLRSEAVYHTAAAFQKDAVYHYDQIKEREVKMAEQVRTLAVLRLHRLHQEVLAEEPPLVSHRRNLYEEGAKREAAGKDGILHELAGAVLLNLADNFYQLRADEISENRISWYRIRGDLRQTIQNTLNRFQAYHLSGITGKRQEIRHTLQRSMNEFREQELLRLREILETEEGQEEDVADASVLAIREELERKREEEREISRELAELVREREVIRNAQSRLEGGPHQHAVERMHRLTGMEELQALEEINQAGRSFQNQGDQNRELQNQSENRSLSHEREKEQVNALREEVRRLNEENRRKWKEESRRKEAKEENRQTMEEAGEENRRKMKEAGEENRQKMKEAGEIAADVLAKISGAQEERKTEEWKLQTDFSPIQIDRERTRKETLLLLEHPELADRYFQEEESVNQPSESLILRRNEDKLHEDKPVTRNEGEVSLQESLIQESDEILSLEEAELTARLTKRKEEHARLADEIQRLERSLAEPLEESVQRLADTIRSEDKQTDILYRRAAADYEQIQTELTAFLTYLESEKGSEESAAVSQIQKALAGQKIQKASAGDRKVTAKRLLVLKETLAKLERKLQTDITKTQTSQIKMMEQQAEWFEKRKTEVKRNYAETLRQIYQIIDRYQFREEDGPENQTVRQARSQKKKLLELLRAPDGKPDEAYVPNLRNNEDHMPEKVRRRRTWAVMEYLDTIRKYPVTEERFAEMHQQIEEDLEEEEQKLQQTKRQVHKVFKETQYRTAANRQNIRQQNIQLYHKQTETFDGELVMEELRNLSGVHRNVNTVYTDGQTSIQNEQVRQQIRIQNEQKQQIRIQNEQVKQQIHEQTDNAVKKSAVNINEMVQRGVQRQIDSISNQVYRRLERRLSDDRKRRGY